MAADPGAEVLLLGDSYTNIYSQADMGWGSALVSRSILHIICGVPWM